MHADAVGHEDAVFDGAVAGESGAGADGDVAREVTIVRDVHVAHDVVVVADGGFGFGLRRAGDGGVFAEDVVIADAQVAAIFFAKFLVHGIDAELRAGVDVIALAERGVALDDDVRIDAAVGADFDAVFDDGVVADAAGGVDARARMDDRGGGGGHGTKLDYSVAIRSDREPAG